MREDGKAGLHKRPKTKGMMPENPATQYEPYAEFAAQLGQAIAGVDQVINGAWGIPPIPKLLDSIARNWRILAVSIPAVALACFVGLAYVEALQNQITSEPSAAQSNPISSDEVTLIRRTRYKSQLRGTAIPTTSLEAITEAEERDFPKQTENPAKLATWECKKALMPYLITNIATMITSEHTEKGRPQKNFLAKETFIQEVAKCLESIAITLKEESIITISGATNFFREHQDVAEVIFYLTEQKLGKSEITGKIKDDIAERISDPLVQNMLDKFVKQIDTPQTEVRNPKSRATVRLR